MCPQNFRYLGSRLISASEIVCFSKTTLTTSNLHFVSAKGKMRRKKSQQSPYNHYDVTFSYIMTQPLPLTFANNNTT